METIFVMIAAYRDPDLAATIEDALGQAEHPDRLRFGVCVQDHVPPPEWIQHHPQVRVDLVPPSESEGVGWARARAQALYDGEDHSLQIDAHTRFEAGFDTTLIRIAAEAPSARPVLTTYPCMFEPGRPVDRAQLPNKAVFLRFNDWGCIEYAPTAMTPDELSGGALPARQFCAGFAFTPGSFVTEVPYDPQMYFVGEEATMAARAFTHGYDLFHPDLTLLYHHYMRPDAPKHWDDHRADPATAERYDLHYERTRVRVRTLLGIEQASVDCGRYGLGEVRSLADFEAYCGADFRRGLVERYAVRGERPPDPTPLAAERDLPQRTFLAVIDVERAVSADAESWHLTIRDRFGTVRTSLPVAAADIARVLLSGRPDLVVPYRAYLRGGSWVLELRNGTELVDTLEGELAAPIDSDSAVWG